MSLSSSGWHENESISLVLINGYILKKYRHPILRIEKSISGVDIIPNRSEVLDLITESPILVGKSVRKIAIGN